MEITLKKIKLEYFKGIKALELEFKEGNNLLLGMNAAGKSTVFDAYTYCLFGKSASGESDLKFGIKTTDANNEVIPKVEHSVTLWLDVDGNEHVIQRLLKENWVKKRGSLESEFSGNVTDYFYNEVPLKKSEFDQKISQLLSEDIFKLISNPLEFNSRHWEVQRAILVSIVGEVNDSDVAKGNKNFEALLSKLSNKSLEEYKDELASKRKKLNEQLKFIPSKIAEVNHGKPEAEDFDTLRKDKANTHAILENIDEQISDQNKAIDEQLKIRQAKSTEIFQLRNDNQNIELSVKKSLQDDNDDSQLRDLERNLNNKVSDIANSEIGIQRLQKELEIAENGLKNASVQVVELREEWQTANATEFKMDKESLECPTCKRPLDSENVELEKEKLLKTFRTKKENNLKSINDSGVLMAAREQEFKKAISTLESRIADGKIYQETAQKEVNSLESQIKSLKSNTQEAVDLEKALQEALGIHKTYQSNLIKISELQAAIEANTGFDISSLKAKREECSAKIIELERSLSKETRINEADERIKELSADEKNYAQQIANLEKEEFLAQEFTIAKIISLESRVNSLFDGISFKLFETQVNGAEVPTCQLIYKGVNFNSLNTAAKTNSGLKVIKALCNYYKVYSTIFIDSRESITDLEPMDSQVISLVVSPEHSKLVVK
jgi:DNA repair exonuclease SbcCD ATPase subunit